MVKSKIFLKNAVPNHMFWKCFCRPGWNPSTHSSSVSQTHVFYNVFVCCTALQPPPHCRLGRVLVTSRTSCGRLLNLSQTLLHALRVLIYGGLHSSPAARLYGLACACRTKEAGVARDAPVCVSHTPHDGVLWGHPQRTCLWASPADSTHLCTPL